MGNTLYDTIGVDYNATRRADPYIVETMLELLQCEEEGSYLDVGCGTGNYLLQFSRAGFNFAGMDPSEVMLEKAKIVCRNLPLVNGKAEEIPFEDEKFDGVTAMFTFHHWEDQKRGLKEIYRILKPGGRAVFLSFTPQQLNGYWLHHYFPLMIKRSGEIVPDQAGMFSMLRQSGFTGMDTQKYFVHATLQDHFLYSNKFRPEQYLNPELRKGISSFAAFSTPDEVENGLKLLEADILSGKINEVMKSYSNNMGDYLFYVAIK